LITAAQFAVAPAYPAPAASATSLRERILLVVLFLAVLASSIAFIEPSPHDALMGVLAVAAMIAGLRFERTLAFPLLTLLLWNAAGLMSLINVAGEDKTIPYAATSVYLAIAALLFACVFARNTMPRLAAMRSAYLLTATLISLAGIAGYFRLFPGAYDYFTMEGRVLGGFKDPNVYGPYLIWPALIVMERMIARRIRIADFLVVAILLFSLLLSFSRGAWFHFGLSCAIMLALVFITAQTQNTRLRILVLSTIGVVALAGLVVLLISFDSIGAMFKERAQLLQSYDVGNGGRFTLQELAVGAVLESPNGMGPFGFSSLNGTQQHNVYLQAFLVYGWVGGMAYVLLILGTLFVGLRTSLVRTPWQPYAITAFATFVGEVAEGFIIDTDHWRHFFLLLGMVWGLAAATSYQAGRAPAPNYAPPG
jgi:O-antigen ligase